MTAKQVARQLHLTRPTVARALVRNGLSRLSFLEPPKPANRYQWPNPGDLIHIDIKKLARIQGIGHRITGRFKGFHQKKWVGWEFAHVCVDDASRLAYGSSSRTSDERASWLFYSEPWLGFVNVASVSVG